MVETLAVPKVLVVCGPSGVGKGTLIGMLRTKYPNRFAYAVSHTSRPPREGEKEGKDYFFVSREEFEKAVSDKKFLEHAIVHGDYYGTSLAQVEYLCGESATPILEIDVQGAEIVHEGPLGKQSLFLFVEASDFSVLEKRLRGRGSETPEKIDRRLLTAIEEMKKSQTFAFHKRIKNEDLATAFAEFENVLKSSGLLHEID